MNSQIKARNILPKKIRIPKAELEGFAREAIAYEAFYGAAEDREFNKLVNLIVLQETIMLRVIRLAVMLGLEQSEHNRLMKALVKKSAARGLIVNKEKYRILITPQVFMQVKNIAYWVGVDTEGIRNMILGAIKKGKEITLQEFERFYVPTKIRSPDDSPIVV